MSKLDELLQGVVMGWLSVDEIFTVKNGYTPSKSKEEYWNDGTIPWFRMEDIRKKGRLLNNALQNVSELALKGKLIPANSLIMSTTATLGEHALVQIPFLTNQQITSFSLKDLYVDNINTKYLFYCFFDFGKWCKNNANQNGGLGIIGLSKLKKYKIPIPCPDNPEKSLEIQQEIVRILDELTSLTNQLTTELETERQNRKKQFEFFREQLLSFEKGNVEWKLMGEVGEFVRGNGLQKTDFTKTGVGCIHYGQIYTYYGNYTTKTKSFVSEELATKLKKVNFSDIIITNTSENIEDVCKAVAWLGNEEIVTGGHACIFKHQQNPKYIVYCTQVISFFKQKKKLAKGTKVMDVSAKDLAKIKIPIPPLEEQERIVKLLDQFDATHSAIEDEITKEIKLRTQQYEYYREKLLSFPQN